MIKTPVIEQLGAAGVEFVNRHMRWAHPAWEITFAACRSELERALGEYVVVVGDRAEDAGYLGLVWGGDASHRAIGQLLAVCVNTLTTLAQSSGDGRPEASEISRAFREHASTLPRSISPQLEPIIQSLVHHVATQDWLASQRERTWHVLLQSGRATFSAKDIEDWKSGTRAASPGYGIVCDLRSRRVQLARVDEFELRQDELDALVKILVATGSPVATSDLTDASNKQKGYDVVHEIKKRHETLRVRIGNVRGKGYVAQGELLNYCVVYE